MENNTKIEKVSIISLINNLIYLHNTGADYVDIIVESDAKEDLISLSVREEYLCEEEEREFLSIINPLHEENKGNMDSEQYFDEIS